MEWFFFINIIQTEFKQKTNIDPIEYTHSKRKEAAKMLGKVVIAAVVVIVVAVIAAIAKKNK